MQFISGFIQTIRDKTSVIISAIGSRVSEAKARRVEKKYRRALESFNFSFSPYDYQDRVVVIKGTVYRVFFSPDGMNIRNEVTDESITDLLLIVKILRGASQ